MANKSGGFKSSRLGAMFFHQEASEDRLAIDVDQGLLVSEFLQTKYWREALEPILLLRREKILNEIKLNETPDSFQKLSGRLQEIDSIKNELVALVQKGHEAQNTLNESKEV